jgi:hypothetical protein
VARPWTTTVSIVLEVRDNEHSLMCPSDRGNDPTVDNDDETERVDRERGIESSNRDGNRPLHNDTQSVEEEKRSNQGWIEGGLV